MKAFVGVTDGDWFHHLSAIEDVDEVNFWQPGGSSTFKALAEGELFLFKLHSPNNVIAGGGIFARWTRLPCSLAWDAFGQKNGAATLAEMRRRIEKYRRAPASPHEDYNIGCILLETPFFLTKEQWIPVPDWKPNIVSGRGYDLTVEPGLSLWRALAAHRAVAVREAPEQRYGPPMAVRPRLGQGTFRVVVTDAYLRRCSITGERTLPVLEAAHIKSYSEGGEHRVDNGLLLRSDLHVLFDRGYVTVTPDYRIEVSKRIREEFENGRDYYALHGGTLRLPPRLDERPAGSLLQWHNEHVYRG